MIIVGAGGHAKEILDILPQNKNKQIYFFESFKRNRERNLHGFEILVGIESLKKKFPTTFKFTFAIGNPKVKEEILRNLQSIGGELISLISDNCLLSNNASYLEGLNLMPFSTIYGNTKIGKAVLVNTHVSVHHDCEIGNFVELSPGAKILGNCKIGNFCRIGSNATVLPGISICSDVIIGAGSVVTKDIIEDGTYCGIPARKIK